MKNFDAVAGLVRETLSLGNDIDVKPDQLLFYDLEFTSLDLLDLLFRVEEQLGVAIPEGTIYRHARGDTPDEQFAEKGYLTPLGRERLMTLLSDSPPAIFPDKIHVQALPRYITVGALVRLVDHLQAQAKAS
ncbi:MAG TPA: acyl carrier protein [Kofleriaceae bacterium]|nr:acyl carrier protein [Kofleriaceae bacterium]